MLPTSGFDADSVDIDLAALRIGGSREANNDNDPFKSVIRKHHRARDITDEFGQAVKGELLHYFLTAYSRR